VVHKKIFFNLLREEVLIHGMENALVPVHSIKGLSSELESLMKYLSHQKFYSAVACVLVWVLAQAPAWAGSLEQAKRIHDRLAGVPPSESVLLAMKNSIDSTGNGLAAADIAMANDSFYRVTIKNWAAPWTNRDQSVFVPLNDYIATVIGMVTTITWPLKPEKVAANRMCIKMYWCAAPKPR